MLVLLLSSGGWLPLLHPGFLNTRAGGDSPFLLVRLDQLLVNLRSGVFPVRWMPDAAYGLGYPFFNYYAALPYYLAAGLVLWGWGPIGALKATQALGLILSGAAMYALGLQVFRRRASAVLASIAYVYAPFHLVNIYVRGDSLSEFCAFVWYPLLGWACLRLRRDTSPGSLLILGGAYGGLILTHNVSALIASPVVIAYVLWLILSGEVTTSGRRRFLWLALASGLLGLGLSSWFWLPALLEQPLVQLQGMTSGYFHFAGHFRGADLIQRGWCFNYGITEGRTPFAMGSVQALLAGGGSLALIGRWIQRRRATAQGLFALISCTCITLCITPLSHLLWRYIPLMAMAQFPWRLLSLQSVFTALLTGCLVEGDLYLKRPEVPPGPDGMRLTELRAVNALTPWGVALLLSGVLMATSLGGLRTEWLDIGDADVSPDRLRLYEYVTANIGTTVRGEYLPQAVETRPFTSAVFIHRGTKPAPMAIEGELAEAHLVDEGPIWEAWDLTAASARAYLGFYTHYFPGWQATVDGVPVPLTPVEGWGMIGLTLPQGHHRVVLRLGNTPVRQIAEWISLSAWVVALGLLVLAARSSSRERRQRWSVGIGLIVVPFIVGAVVLRLVSTQAPPHTTSSLTMDLTRQPYLHHNAEGVQFEGSASLLRYSLSADEVQSGEPLTVTLGWRVMTSRALTATVHLASAAEPIVGQSSLRANRSHVPLEGDQTLHRVEVPPEAVTGPYLIGIELRQAGGSLAPVAPGDQELGTTYLIPIWVRAAKRRVPSQQRLGDFGERIALLAAQTERRGSRQLLVHLTWQALRPIPANYNLSLRLKDPAGQQVATRDLQPHYGFYPTSLWPPGLPVDDNLTLAIPKDTPPGEGYTLEIVLYSVSTLFPIGRAEAGDIQL